MKSEGIKTLVRKLRLCQSARGRKRTRVERLAPSSNSWRTTFLRLFFEKRIGTSAKAYKLAPVKQTFRVDERWIGNAWEKLSLLLIAIAVDCG